MLTHAAVLFPQRSASAGGSEAEVDLVGIGELLQQLVGGGAERHGHRVVVRRPQGCAPVPGVGGHVSV